MFKVVDGKSSREDLIAFLNQAVQAGAIRSVEDVSLREIIVVGLIGQLYIFEWYTNVVTLKSGQLDMWFTEAMLSNNHPDYHILIEFSVRDFAVAYLGRRR